MFDIKRLSGKFVTGTIWSKTRSITNKVASQIYTHKCGFNWIYHLHRANGKQVGHSLSAFISEFEEHYHLMYDGAAFQVGTNTSFMDTVRRSEIDYHVLESRRPNKNQEEGPIREVKRRFYQVMLKKRLPKCLWDFVLDWICEIDNMTVNSSRYTNGRTPLDIITGITPDITEYLDFGFYDWVVFKQNAGVDTPKIGRWLGVSHWIGQLMTYWILPASGILISCGTVQRLTVLEEQAS